ncbi:uncharacterized protein LOC135109553 isoform X1 [Scylla paramamosain]|uniref:uncharacterized protein LOC135109553 isoform X1 n=2 Tax=Scylla paramamosain TaxID=85552 RepID=UPI0030828E12
MGHSYPPPAPPQPNSVIALIPRGPRPPYLRAARRHGRKGTPHCHSLPGRTNTHIRAYSIIWMREHNCVCDELLKTHPNLGMTTASTRLSALLSSLSSLTSRNHTHALYPVLEEVNENGRQLRFQGLYTYRRRFSMQPFTSFLDLAGDPKLAADLEHFCRDIEAVEYYVSLVTARPSPSVTLPSTVSLGGPWSVKGLVAAHLQP